MNLRFRLTKHCYLDPLTFVLDEVIQTSDSVRYVERIKPSCLFFQLPLEELSEGGEAKQNLQMVLAP